ncbi:O-methyltransferase-domain-containing protein, partial [Phaeosphaeriaceae sp. PMI808]
RAQVIEESKQLTRTLQTPVERAWDLFLQPTQPAALQVALDAGWLNLINAGHADESGAGVTANQIAEHTVSDVSLVKRIMRVLTANMVVRESGTDRYTPTPFSKLFDTPEWANGLRHALRDYSITMAEMPKYLAKYEYHPDVAGEGNYEYVHGIPFLERVRQGGEVGMQFTSFMTVVRAGKSQWFDVYPVEEKLKVLCDTDVLLVDVGGGNGHDLASFSNIRTKLCLEGRLVLQDVPAVLAHVKAEYKDTMEVQAHDFFTSQKVSGARAYFLKHVLHDWPDKDCVNILTHARDAMKVGYSRLLISEIVLANQKCEPWIAAFDVTMMAVVRGKERSESEWEALISSTKGLVIEKIWEFGPKHESIIE